MPAARSIRTRLLICILASLVLILGLAAWASYEVSKHEAEELFAARLATSARVFEALVARQVEHATIASPLVIALPKELESSGGDAGSPFGHLYETKIAFQVWRDDGMLLVRTASAPTQAFSPNLEGFSKQNLEGELWQVFVLRSGNSWIQVAEKDEVRDELMHNLGVAVMTPLIAGALLLLIVANLLVMYGLAPLRELAAGIEGREPESLGQLEMSHVPKEVVPVVRALNDLLSRVSLAFEHERRFTDAAAHELRTPLAALKIHADNLARASSEDERLQSMTSLRLGLERAIKLADQMLAYSRTQDTGDREQRVPIRMADAVAETVTSLEPLRRQQSQTLRLVAEPPAEAAEIMGEPMKIQRLIRNLLDNASRYAPEGSEIKVGVKQQGDRIVFSVGNHGAVIAPELLQRIFEPYYRIPGSRSEGSGLGLAIVKEIADQHAATITLSTLGDGDGTVVTVSFPRAA